MHRRFLFGSGLLLIAALVLLCGASVAHAEGGPPEAHPDIIEFTGSETCAMFHPNTGQEVVESLHYQEQGKEPCP